MANASQSLLCIINDILDFSKIEAGKMALDRTEFILGELFEHLADMFCLQCTQKRLELVLCAAETCQYALIGDPLRLKQVLIDLLGNAIKFTDEGEIEVQVKTERALDNQVTLLFSVRDTGIGMTEEQAGKLFSAFTQVDSSSTRKFSGTGLGLSICKKLVEMMEGRMWVASEPGRGSIFYFTATFKRELGKRDAQRIMPEEMEHLRVLVVEDNLSARHMVQSALETWNFVVTGVASGPEALAAVKRGVDEGVSYAFAIVDWSLPEMNGVEVIGKIQEMTLGVTPPKTLLLTPYDQEETIKIQGDKVGVDAYLSKPANCLSLLYQILEMFGAVLPKSLRKRKGGLDLAYVAEQVGGAHILLVEDNAINRQVAKEILMGVAMVVDVAENGQEALTKVAAFTYDAVLMDIQMPIMDGYTATRWIRSHPEHQTLPILAMTAHATIEDHENCLASGMNAHVAKPIDKNNLYSTLIQWIQPREGLGEKIYPSPAQLSEETALLFVEDDLPGIHMANVLERLNGNQKLLRTLLLEFHRDFVHAREELQTLLNGQRQEDYEKAARLAHTIRGMAGNLSAETLFHEAELLEKAILAGHKKEWASLLERFDVALRKILHSIAALPPEAKSHPSGGYAPEDISKAQSIVFELAELINANSLESLQRFESLKQALGAGMLSEDIERLGAALHQMAFAEAQTALTVISLAVGKM